MRHKTKFPGEELGVRGGGRGGGVGERGLGSWTLPCVCMETETLRRECRSVVGPRSVRRITPFSVLTDTRTGRDTVASGCGGRERQKDIAGGGG